jgi:hypothetical protein
MARRRAGCGTLPLVKTLNAVFLIFTNDYGDKLLAPDL